MGLMRIVQNYELIFDDDDHDFDDDCTSNKSRLVGRHPLCTCFEKLFERSSYFTVPLYPSPKIKLFELSKNASFFNIQIWAATKISKLGH